MRITRKAYALGAALVLAVTGTGLAAAQAATGVGTAHVTLTNSAGAYACTVAVPDGTTFDCDLAVAQAAPAPSPTPTATTPAPTPTATTPAPSPTPTATTPAPTPTPTPTSNETVVPGTYVTGYGWWDNTPAGSSDISNPVIHTKAGGTGTYADPVTVAVGHSLATGKDVLDYPQGTKFYIPNVKKYFIVEDTCGDGGAPQNIGCHQLYGTANGNDADPGATKWVDIWIGGASATHTASDNCENALTKVQTMIVNPKATYAVVSGDILQSGVCRQGYGNTAQ